MSDKISFKNKVVIITGAGGGLGKQYALNFAERGAKVVVNDLGGSLQGQGNSTKSADLVVNEIRSKGGIAVANYDNIVTNPEGILRTSIDNFGTVHILINNAGILKDASFRKMTEKQFKDVLDVHLNGSYKLTKACWPYFRNQKYGRVILTASPAGLYGNFGQANYSAAKLGMVGLGETLAKEGFKYNIKVNIIAPLAKSRMTETIMPPDILGKLSPGKICPIVLALTSTECPTSGKIYEVAAGLYAQIRWERSHGLYLKPDSSLTPEAILSRLPEIFNRSKGESQYPIQLNDYNAIWNKTRTLPSNSQGNVKIDSLRNKVVIVTGAGAGLGKSHALLFARYGAKVVVNDFKDPYTVVEEIKKKGGTAIPAKFDVYSEADKIVKAAIKSYGAVHVLINNAGILRDRSFLKINDEEWTAVMNIHLLATFRLCKEVWPLFLKQGGGFIVNTTSTSGIYGNFGQANYAAAKAAILGFTRTLAIEGKNHHIVCNAIAPHAETAMTRTIFQGSELGKFSPAQVSPLVVLLTSVEAKGITGELFEVGAGWFGNTRWQRAKGAVSHEKIIPAEFIMENWSDIVDYTKGFHVKTAQDSAMKILDAIDGNEDEEEDEDDQNEEGENSSSETSDDGIYKYDEKSVILYNISVGSKADELKYTYENSSNFQVIPSFGVIPFLHIGDDGPDFSEFLQGYDFSNLLHGEHYLKIHRFPIPASGKLKTETRPIAVLNKNKKDKHNVLLMIRYDTYTEADGKKQKLFTNIASYFIRNSRSKDSKDHTYSRTENKFCVNKFKIPDRKPDFVGSFKTGHEQAALYRLNGDMNPLHIDPTIATSAGFRKPILHGLCTFGISSKILVAKYGPFDEAKVRFTQAVYPGETIEVMTWKEGNTVIFKTKAVDRDIVVINNAAVKLVNEPQAKL